MNIGIWKISTLGFAGAFALTVGWNGINTVEAAKQPRMESALEKLAHAKRDLEAASKNKEGHRVKALEAVEKAIAEVKEGIKAGEEAQDERPPAAEPQPQTKPKTERVKNPK